MTWKLVTNSDAGDADHFGGNDIDKISNFFSAVDVSEGLNIQLPSVNTSTTTNKGVYVAQTITATGATAFDYPPVKFDFTLLSTDVSNPFDLICTGLEVFTTYGSAGVDAKGTCHTCTFNQDIKGSSSVNNEIACIMGWNRSNTAEPASQWFTDFNMHGPIAVQPGMLAGLNMFINNYYNGSPSRNTSAGAVITTISGSGGGATASHSSATTYPVDLGLIIHGFSGVPAGTKTKGFNIGLQIGGFGGSWLSSGTSKIGTGMKILDCDDHCIDASSQGALTGYVLKLPNDGLIGRSATGNQSWDSSDVLTIKASNIKTIGSDGTTHYAAGYRPDVKKYGSWSGTTSGSGDGILNGRTIPIAVGTGTSSGITDTTGCARTFDTAATVNSIAGVMADSQFMTRINNAYFKANITTGASIANVRIYCGLVAAAAAPTSLADPLNAKAGVALWFDSAVNANWRRYHNDASGAGVSDDTTLAVVAATNYTVEIEAVADTKFVFRFNSVNTDITADIPPSGTGLAFWIYVENTTAASRTIKGYYAVIRTDK